MSEEVICEDPDCQEYVEAYPEDVEQIQLALAERGYGATPLLAATLWAKYSDSLSAGWIVLGDREWIWSCIEKWVMPLVATTERVWRPPPDAPAFAHLLFEKMCQLGRAGEPFFLGAPDAWLADRTLRCVNQHVSKGGLGTERGTMCLACGERVYLTFPEDVDGSPLSGETDRA
ncbi:MAG: hypothetical protein GY871_04295 [Actinomycetales bacterium]|nr:hypothetical protein [Actinomycetales bacterium]